MLPIEILYIIINKNKMMKHLVVLSALALSLALAKNNTYSECLMSSTQYNSHTGISTCQDSNATI
jgi:hypothetical protein